MAWFQQAATKRYGPCVQCCQISLGSCVRRNLQPTQWLSLQGLKDQLQPDKKIHRGMHLFLLDPELLYSIFLHWPWSMFALRIKLSAGANAMSQTPPTPPSPCSLSLSLSLLGLCLSL